ncbi:MAG: histidine ammonia-lyase [Candidatus Bathyarchaeia archaeon]
MAVRIDGKSLRIQDVVGVARNGLEIQLSEESLKRVIECREFLEGKVEQGQTVYGVNTGVGDLYRVKISDKDLKRLQLNLARSHACSVGEPYSIEEVRAIMLLRLNALAKGYSGVRPVVLRSLVDLLNKHVTPVIPGSGVTGGAMSLHTSAHMTLVMVGEGTAFVDGEVVPALVALRKAGLEPVVLDFREGLALMSGDPIAAALGCFIVHDGENILKSLDIAAALTLEVLLGRMDPFDDELHLLKPHQKNIVTAQNIRRLVEKSALVNTIERVQDATSLRLIPYAHGAQKQALQCLKDAIEVELNSVTDNPVVIPEKHRIIHAGNWSVDFICLAFDLVTSALSNAATHSTKRIERLVNPSLSKLPAFLIEDAGLRSGLMLTQYVAEVLASQSRILAHPQSVEINSFSAGQEDYYINGVAAGNKTMWVLKQAATVVSIELICACEAAEFRGPQKLGVGSKSAYDFVRSVVPRVDEDRSLTSEITKLGEMVSQGKLVQFVEEKIGPLAV